MKLSEISIQRPVLAAMMNLALVLFGLVALTRLPVRELPDIDPPVVSVLTVYPGANADQIKLAFQRFAVAHGLSATAPAQLQFQLVILIGPGAQHAGFLALADHVPVAAAAMGAQAGEQLHPLQQVRFALAVGADHQQPRALQGEAEGAEVAELVEFEAVQPDGSGAASG